MNKIKIGLGRPNSGVKVNWPNKDDRKLKTNGFTSGTTVGVFVYSLLVAKLRVSISSKADKAQISERRRKAGISIKSYFQCELL